MQRTVQAQQQIWPEAEVGVQNNRKRLSIKRGGWDSNPRPLEWIEAALATGLADMLAVEHSGNSK